MSRLEQIRSMLEREPDDLFLNFGLAMELAKGDDLDGALAAFDRVISLDADHPPGYFQKAMMLVRSDRIDEARSCLEAGIEAAKRGGDQHAADEMAGVLVTLR